MLKLKKINLILFTGFIWFWASLVLFYRAYSWGILFSKNELILTIILGFIIAIIKTYLVFKNITNSNITRISNFKEEKVSILQFHLPKDKLLIVVMIVGGSLLRRSDSIPKLYLMPIYLGIGLAMLYSSYLYFKFFINNYKKLS
ncbi:MAG: hypothetical protein GXO49_00525 [Chlorobi bacterium]|nr:hypothetical protein [Chlorobiota bacterium]